MVASHETVSQIIKIMLRHIDHKTAVKLSRDLHNRVKGNQSVVDTFGRIAEHLFNHEEEPATKKSKE